MSTRVGQLVENYVRALGVDCTYDQVQKHLAEEGLSCSEPTFYKYKRLVREEFERGAEARKPAKPLKEFPPPMAPAPNPGVATHEHNGKHTPCTPATPQPDRFGYLEKMVRFGAVVEAVGGVQIARELLAGIEQLQAIFDKPR